MNIQELKVFFTKSDYSDEAKSKIINILSEEVEVNEDLFSKIRDILQNELDADFIKYGIDLTNDPEAKIIEQEFAAQLAIIEDDLKKDMDLVEDELNKLEIIRVKLLKDSDEIEIKKIKDSIK